MLVTGILIGIIATIGMDIWALLVKHVLRLPVTDWAMIGRWVAYIPKGRYFHSPIASADKIGHELAIGWTVHYLTGVIYGVLYLFIVQEVLGYIPTIQSALIFGLATLAAPWLVMQPGLGLGLFASKAPKPWQVRLINISMHMVFAIALYFGWQFMGYINAGQHAP
jgi:hypothetical protein